MLAAVAFAPAPTSERMAFTPASTGTPRETMSASTVNGRLSERRRPPCFLIFPSSTAGTPACTADAAAWISSAVATVPRARWAVAISRARVRTAATMRGPSAPMACP
jgi:hypothetical protein